MVTVGRTACAFAWVLVALGCGGQSRLERSEGESGRRRGDGRGGSSGASGGSTNGGSTNGGSTNGGSTTGGNAGADPGIPPLACDEGDPVVLRPEETAGRLARLFYRAEATDAFVARAREHGLATTGAVGCFVRDLLSEPESGAGIADFFEGWLELGVHATPAQAPEYVPEFTLDLFAKAKAASVSHATTLLLFGETFTRLLTEPVVSADAELAALYGYEDTDAWSPGFTRLALPTERAGIFTQLYFLMSRASIAHGSPTQRGVGLAMMLGCADIPLPPVNFVETVPAEFDGKTTRAWYEDFLDYEQCRGCHSQLTTAGYALEHFDVLGRYRDSEAGVPIDASGELTLVESGPVTGHGEAMHAAAASPIARRCFAEHWLSYAASSVYGERVYATSNTGPDASWLEHVVARAAYHPDFDLREMAIAGVEGGPFLEPLVEP
jgi:hypothetical protein